MNMKFINWLPATWLRSLIIVLLVLGVFFRFVNLDKKVYWIDESLTSLRIAGYTLVEFYQRVPENQVIDKEYFHKYQRPNSEKGLSDTIKSLAVEDPLQPPLYFVLARFWEQMFGSSVAVKRSLSAIISLLVFPCLYWLCRELFESSMVGWVAIALIAVSPFHVLYAQEVRQYSLWTVTILLSSASLLQAIRLKTKISWVIYAATVVLALYIHLFSIFVFIGHGIYVVITERFRLSKTLTAYLLASVAALLTFVPWLTNIYKVRAPSWTAKSMEFSALVKIWVAHPSRIFFDINLDSNDSLLYTVPPILILLIMIGYAIYFMCRQTPKQVWLFVLTLIGVTPLSLILSDLILGGRLSSVSRYLTPCYLGIQLAVAYLFATKIVSILSQRKLWQVMMTLLISAGVVSCVASSQADTWWTKKPSHNNPQVARLINQANRPLLVSSNYNLFGVVSISYLLESKVRLQLVNEPNLPKINENFSEVFLFDPSKKMQNRLEKEQKYKIKPVYALGRLWRLEKS